MDRQAIKLALTGLSGNKPFVVSRASTRGKNSQSLQQLLQGHPPALCRCVLPLSPRVSVSLSLYPTPPISLTLSSELLSVLEKIIILSFVLYRLSLPFTTRSRIRARPSFSVWQQVVLEVDSLFVLNSNGAMRECRKVFVHVCAYVCCFGDFFSPGPLFFSLCIKGF